LATNNANDQACNIAPGRFASNGGSSCYVVHQLKQYGDPWRLSEELPPPGKRHSTWHQGQLMNRLLIVGILIISTARLFAQAQQPNAAELAQKVVFIISGDKAKTQTYCQILDLSDELDQADQQKDREKAEELSQKINELQKKLGPEYLVLLRATEHVDTNSKDGQEIVSNFVKLDNFCGQR
jgi:hypothetical protein